VLAELRAGWRAPIGAAAACALLAAVVIHLLPVEYESRATVELAGGPIEMPRRTELRLLAIARERAPEVRVEVDVGIDRRSERTNVLELRFAAPRPEGLAEAAASIIEETLAPHPAFHAHRLPMWRDQLRLIDEYLAAHPQICCEGRDKVEALAALTRSVVESLPSRATIGPTEARARELHLPIKLAGAALFGLLLGIAALAAFTQGARWSDPIGRRAVELMRARGLLLLLGTAAGAVAGAIAGMALPQEPKLRALIEPAALDHHTPVTRTDELAEIVSREVPGPTVRWVHDLSPYRNRASLLEVIADSEAEIDRVLAFVAEREDPGLPGVIERNRDKIAMIERELPITEDPTQFARHLSGITYARERDGPGKPTRLFCKPWREETKSNVRIYSALGAAAGLLLTIAAATRRGSAASPPGGR
jgi:hypothetical protein